MDAVTMRSETRRVLITLTVVGSLLLMAGAGLGVFAAVPGLAPSWGRLAATLLAWCFVGAGLLCGAAMVALAAAGERRPLGRVRRHRGRLGVAARDRRRTRRAAADGERGRRRASPGRDGG